MCFSLPSLLVCSHFGDPNEFLLYNLKLHIDAIDPDVNVRMQVYLSHLQVLQRNSEVGGSREEIQGSVISCAFFSSSRCLTEFSSG